MKPSEILRLLGAAKILIQDPKTAPEGFLLAYVAWEGFKVRVLIVGLAAEGKSVAEAQKILKERRVWKYKNYQALFLQLFGSNPESAKGIGAQYRSAQLTDRLRGHYLHGAGRTNPQNFVSKTEILISVIESEWAKHLESFLKRAGKPSPYNNPLKFIRRNIVSSKESG